MIHSGVTAFVAMLVIAAVVAVISRRVVVPYVTLLSLAGIVVGSVFGKDIPQLDPALVLFVFLPGLLFESAFNLDWAVLRKNLMAVTLLATAGVALTMMVVAGIGSRVLGLSLPVALLFGAAVAATDPVAVVGAFRRLRVPDRLVNLVEAESLLNDGTGVVVFTIALAVASGAALSPVGALLDFARLSAGGLLLGLALGFVLSRVAGLVEEPQVEMTVTAVAAYGGYLLGEAVHVSGILTVVAAGLVIGNHGRQHHLSNRAQVAVDVLWDYIAFVLNSGLFLLIGAAVPLRDLASHLTAVLVGIVIVLVARGLVVYGIFGLLRPLGQQIPARWQHLVVWGGLRGTVAVALLLSIPAGLQGGETVRALVYGVVLSSLLIQGATIAPVARAALRTEAGQVATRSGGRARS